MNILIGTLAAMSMSAASPDGEAPLILQCQIEGAEVLEGDVEDQAICEQMAAGLARGLDRPVTTGDSGEDAHWHIRARVKVTALAGFLLDADYCVDGKHESYEKIHYTIMDRKPRLEDASTLGSNLAKLIRTTQ